MPLAHPRHHPPALLLMVGALATVSPLPSCNSCERSQAEGSPAVDPAVPTLHAERGCGSAVVRFDGTPLDLAPPAGFTEVCRQDRALCEAFAHTYPPVVTTVGYFWTAREWQARQSGQQIAPSRYLIAQVSSRPPDSFAALKQSLRSKAGAVPDKSKTPELKQLVENVNLGVVGESTDSISIGAMLRPRVPSRAPELGSQIIINTALLTRASVLILYVHHAFDDEPNVDAAKSDTEAWISCLREAAAPAE